MEVLSLSDRKKLFYDYKLILHKVPENVDYVEYEWGRVYNKKVTGFIDLFRYDYKITSQKHLEWHVYTIMYMNPKLETSKLDNIINHLINPINGFMHSKVVKDISLDKLKYNMNRYYVEEEPKSKPRKIVFYSNCKLSVAEKLSLVGIHAGKGKRITQEVIYEAMIMIHYDYQEKITVEKLASMLDCTSRTVHRNMGIELKQEKELLNSEL